MHSNNAIRLTFGVSCRRGKRDVFGADLRLKRLREVREGRRDGGRPPPKSWDGIERFEP